MTLSTQVDPVLSRERKFFISGFMWRDTARVAFLSIFSSKPGTLPVISNRIISGWPLLYIVCRYLITTLNIVYSALALIFYLSRTLFRTLYYIRVASIPCISQHLAPCQTPLTAVATLLLYTLCIVLFISIHYYLLYYYILYYYSYLSLLYIVFLAHFTPPPARRTIYSRRPCTSLLHLVSTIYSTDAQLYTLYIGLLYVVYFSLVPAHDFVAQYVVVVFYSTLLHLVAARFALSRIFSVLPYNCIA